MSSDIKKPLVQKLRGLVFSFFTELIPISEVSFLPIGGVPPPLVREGILNSSEVYPPFLSPQLWGGCQVPVKGNSVFPFAQQSCSALMWRGFAPRHEFFRLILWFLIAFFY